MPEPQSMAAMKRRIGALEEEVKTLGVILRQCVAEIDKLIAKTEGQSETPAPAFYNQGHTPAGGTDGS